MTKTSHTILKAFRVLHLYVGVFTAPALLFFAFTGALQTFSLHETTRGSSYKPPQWAVVLGQIHKKQTPVVGKKPPTPAMSTKPVEQAKPHEPEPAREQAAPAPQTAVKQHNPLPLKIFFLIVAIGLGLSTMTGIYMSYKYSRNKLAVTTLLILGAVIPVMLVLL